MAEVIRLQLIADGMFLVGSDIVGDKILEVNVFSPGNLKSIGDMNGVDFAQPIIESLENKLKNLEGLSARIQQLRAGDALTALGGLRSFPKLSLGTVTIKPSILESSKSAIGPEEGTIQQGKP